MSFRFLTILVSMLLVTSLGIGSAHADSVILKNGDRMTGDIKSLAEGKLHLSTAYSKEALVIDWQDVVSLETDEDVTLLFPSGELLKGRLRSTKTDRTLQITGSKIPEATFPLDDITAINPPAEALKVEGDVTFGGTHQSGNTDRTGASLAFDATAKDKKHRYTVAFLYNYAEEDKTVTDRNMFARIKYDYFWTDSFYNYLNTEFLYDKFKDLKLRTVIGPGVGYQIWDEEKRSLALEAGLAYYDENRDEGEDDSWVTARLATIFFYKFESGLKFSETLTLYPSLENSDDFTLRSEAALTTPRSHGWALQLKNIVDHDSDPDSPDVDKTDSTWILGLNYSF